MDIKIVKYDDSNAAKVADMWNHSRDGWGGANTVDTEETVLQRERNSTNIHTYLALDGEKVVGYCGLSEYRDDEGALYIPLLNVRDDYHGRKIGKKLLLTALQEAINLKWPRLDLYTWSGNTKAVPLYKKCGFFWEDRDDTTHLMNFMPTVLHTEAVTDFFKDTDWYDISTREIEVKPDGRIENDFHYYEYSWAKENEFLRIEFERTGRGIRLIETDDYLISATVSNHQLVFGDEYEVIYKINNKSGKPLHVDLEGLSDKNIDFHFQTKLEVEKEVEVTGTFYVGAIEEEQNNLRTHPTVQTIVKINGKKAVFKTGVLPKYPAQVKAQIQEDLTFIGKEQVFYLDLENNYDEKIQFVFELPSSPLLELSTPNIDVKLAPKGKQSIPVRFNTLAHGFYSTDLQIKAIKENGEAVHFTRKIGIPLRGIGAKFAGEDDERIQIYNGQYFATLKKQGAVIGMGRSKKDSDLMIMAPKIGKPYSEEITKQKVKLFEFFEGEGFNGAKITYELNAFPTIKIHFILKLYGEGLFEHYYEVENKTDQLTEHEVWINQSIYMGLDRAIIPSEGKIIEMKDSIGNSYSYWKDRNVSENWLFVPDTKNPIGLCWHEEDDIHFGSWFNFFEHDLGQFQGRETKRTNSIYFSLGAFHDYESFRSFARQTFTKVVDKTVEHLTVSAKNNNPFVIGDKVNIVVKDFKSNYLHGKISASVASIEGKKIVKEFDREDELTEWDVEVPLEKDRLVQTIKLQTELDAAKQERNVVIFRQSGLQYIEKTIEDEGLQSLFADNGLIQLKASPDFFPSIYSLKYKGYEWLDSSFPKLKPKQWWNPWAGGLTSLLDDIRPHSIKKEKVIGDFARLVDNKGNEWRGIKMSTVFEKNEDFKGLTVHQYFLMLPGTPIVCQVNEIEQKTGRFLFNYLLMNDAFFKPAENIEDIFAKYEDDTGKWSTIVAGKDENELLVNENLIIGANQLSDHIQLIANQENTERVMYINKEIVVSGVYEKLTIPTDTTYFTKPAFYVFTDQIIPVSAQHDLQNIFFDKQD